MRRFHSPREHAIMLRRWRQELGNHDWEYGQDYPRCYLAPPGDAEGVSCHCAHGIGTMRKRTPYGCGKPRCGVCHWEKFYEPKARHNKRLEAVVFERRAEGGWVAEERGAGVVPGRPAGLGWRWAVVGG